MQCLTLSLEQSLRKESLIYRFFVASTSMQIIFPSTLSCRVGTLQISIVYICMYVCRTTPKSDPPTQLNITPACKSSFRCICKTTPKSDPPTQLNITPACKSSFRCIRKTTPKSDPPTQLNITLACKSSFRCIRKTTPKSDPPTQLNITPACKSSFRCIRKTTPKSDPPNRLKHKHQEKCHIRPQSSHSPLKQ